MEDAAMTEAPSPTNAPREPSPRGAITRLTHAVLAHKRAVVIFWAIITLVGIGSAGSATKALKQKFSVPGKEGWVTNQQIQHEFHGTGGNNSALLPVVTLPAGASFSSPSVRGELKAVEDKMAQTLPGSLIAG